MTNGALCQRWIALSDRAAMEDALSDEERRFLVEHPPLCRACANERDAYAELDGPLETVMDAGQLELAERRVLVAMQSRQRVRTIRFAAGLGIVAAAAGAAITLAPRSSAPTPPAVASAVHRRDSRTAPIAQGMQARSEAALAGCERISSGIRTCIAGSTRAVVADESPTRRAVRLTSGRVVVELDPQPTGSSFSVVTDVVKVTAIGTVFTVEVPDPATSAVLVRVLEGTVAVEPKHGPVMRLSAPGAVKVARSVEPTPLVATDAARDWELLGKPVVTPTATANEAERTAPVSTARELLDKARVLRAQGRFTEAANAYARLRTSHPRSKEAHVALLSMGELQLSHLGNASAALRWFQTYVDAGGPLVQEARYGKIRALRQLGRTAQEKREIQRFLSDYPHSVQTPGLRARAGEL